MSVRRTPLGRRSTGDHQDLSSSRRQERQLDDPTRIQIGENLPTVCTASPVGANILQDKDLNLYEKDRMK